MRYHHRGFLLLCQGNNVVPQGLKAQKTANIVKFSEHFERKWDEILLNTSKEMRELVFSEVEIGIDLVTHEFWNWKGLL